MGAAPEATPLCRATAALRTLAAPQAAAAPLPGGLSDALAVHPEVLGALDEAAVRRLHSADPDRAVEVVEELAAKTDVQNPSAFVVKALASYPHKRGQRGDVDELLARHPTIEASLDEAALAKLKGAEPARAVEIIEDIAAKGDVQNTSAFVVKALGAYPHKRGTPKNVTQVLAKYPEVRDTLDEAAHIKLGEADPARAVEIIEDIAARGDVRNPSAFVAKALQLYPHKRSGYSEGPPARPAFAVAAHAPGISAVMGAAAVMGVAGVALQSGGAVDKELAHNPGVGRGLDSEALRALSQADPGRAVEIIRDVAAKLGQVRNPSAFVVQALKAFPQRRGDPNDLEATLARLPRVRAALDAAALQRLREADPARAAEVLEDVAAKTDVHNPSAFVVKALTAHPLKRGHEDNGVVVLPPVKLFRSALASPVSRGAPRVHGLSGVSASSLASQLDEQAQRLLAVADPLRANEILEELAEKVGQVRNASAFVARALQQYPHPRGRRAT